MMNHRNPAAQWKAIYAVLFLLAIVAVAPAVLAAEKPIKVFILAGDENMLEQGVISRQDKEGKEYPGTLIDILAKQPCFAFLKDKEGKWTTRNDVVLYDGHPIHNNTVSMGQALQVGDRAYGGERKRNMIGPELMFGHVVGNALEEPVLLIRFAVHSVFHTPGNRSLAHDFRSPSTGGGQDLDGSWDVIHFNWGVWDTGYLRQDGKRGYDKVNGKKRVSIDDYERNLRILVAKMKKTSATLIWGSTTPIHEGCPTSIKGDEVRYNAVAAKIMEENGVIINDLYHESLRQGYPTRPDVHSVGNLGPITLKAIEAALKTRKNPTKPMPRVLFIGDSISSTYLEHIKSNLDGKASVYHNPGNGEHSGTGIKKIDEWLDLETYLLNGQEYLELVKGVKAVLENPKRFYPDYNGQKLELGGLVWFQGISDSSTEAKAKLYEKNLTCLIADLRKDFDLPGLPVVVAASMHGKAPSSSAQKLVHSAQIAVGDAKKNGKFSGTVTSIDTTPFFRDNNQSPGYFINEKRPLFYAGARYNNNAESFLLIGEAMGQAMLKLLYKSELQEK
jgi:hypothetical protein